MKLNNSLPSFILHYYQIYYFDTVKILSNLVVNIDILISLSIDIKIQFYINKVLEIIIEIDFWKEIIMEQSSISLTLETMTIGFWSR